MKSLVLSLFSFALLGLGLMCLVLIRRVRTHMALAALIAAMPAAPITANAAPITYEIGIIVTNYRLYDPALDAAPPSLEIGNEAQFRATFDRDDRYSDGRFAARLDAISLAGTWVDVSVDGFGFDESDLGEEACDSHTVYGCSALFFGRGSTSYMRPSGDYIYTFFSHWSIEHWLDPWSSSGLQSNPSNHYFFCNIVDCDFGGTGTMEYIKAVPEAGGAALFGLGLASLGLSRRRKQST